MNMSMVTLPVGILALLVTIFFLKVDISVQARGYLQIKNKNIVVEHPNGGRIAKLYVHEGQTVRKDELLAVIENSYISEEYNKGEMLVAALQMRKERLQAEINDADFPWQGETDSAAYQIYKLEYEYYLADRKNKENELRVSQSVQEQKMSELRANQVRSEGLAQEVAYNEKQVKMISGLVSSGAAAEGTLLAKRAEAQKTKNDLNNTLSERDVIGKALERARLDTEKLSKNYIIDKQNELMRVQDQLSEATARLSGASARKRQEEIASPVNGRIQSLSKSHEGSVISPGGELFEIAPADVPVIAAVRLDTRDRDRIWSGMAAKVEINGLKNTPGDSLQGTVGIISADSFSDEHNQGRYYQVEIVLSAAADRKKQIYPGMAVDAWITIGQRTLAEYIFQPLLQDMEHAFSEP